MCGALACVGCGADRSREGSATLVTLFRDTHMIAINTFAEELILQSTQVDPVTYKAIEERLQLETWRKKTQMK